MIGPRTGEAYIRVPRMPQPVGVVQLAAVERSGMAANGQVYGKCPEGQLPYTVLANVFLFSLTNQ